jgi:hypothetical protein
MLEELGGSSGRMRETGQELGDPEQAGRCTEAGGMGAGDGKKKHKTPLLLWKQGLDSGSLGTDHLSDVSLMNDHSDVNADICNNDESADVGATRLHSVLERTMYGLNLGPVSNE